MLHSGHTSVSSSLVLFFQPVLTTKVEGRGNGIKTVITNMMNRDGWEAMHTQFPVTLIACPHCGEDVLETGLQLHTTKSARCLWLRADTEVTKLRTAGYTDPYALRPTVPVTWTALRTGPWRNTTIAVSYPKAVQAVLVRT